MLWRFPRKTLRMYKKAFPTAKDISQANLLLSGGRVVLVSGGPSLDYLEENIRGWVDDDYAFVLADVIATLFIKRWNPRNRIIFSVESRRHSYLSMLDSGENIAFYRHAHPGNLPVKAPNVFAFCMDFDPDCGFTRLRSPGTVTGAALFWILDVFQNRMPATDEYILELAGLDLSFPDTQYFNRYAYPRVAFATSYLARMETREMGMVLAKADYALLREGFAVKTSMEFRKTKNNMEHLLQSVRNNIQIYNNTPLGLEHPFIHPFRMRQ